MLLNDLTNDLEDELHQLETETFEVEDITDLGLDAPMALSWTSSSCSTSSCCSCSTSSCCSTSTSCTG